MLARVSKYFTKGVRRSFGAAAAASFTALHLEKTKFLTNPHNEDLPHEIIDPVFQSDTEDRIRGAFFGALVGDALCLGSHYEYDAPTIKQAYGGKVINEFMAPGERMGGTTHGIGWGRRNYHPGQKKGDQTDNGLYNILLLEYLSSLPDPTVFPLHLPSLLPVWRQKLFSEAWGAWKCSVTKTTLQQYSQGITSAKQLGGMSNAMAFRSAAAHAIWTDEEKVAAVARQAMFTHQNEQALSGGDFFARVTHRIIHDNLTPREAIETVAREASTWIQQLVATAMAKVDEATDPSTALAKEEFADDLAITSMARLWDVGKSEPIRVGKASPTEGVLPGSIYVILKYMDDFKAGVTANAMIGGDNASRGVNVGLVLGAYHGVAAIPENWQTTLNAWNSCDRMLNKLPLLGCGDEKNGDAAKNEL